MEGVIPFDQAHDALHVEVVGARVKYRAHRRSRQLTDRRHQIDGGIPHVAEFGRVVREDDGPVNALQGGRGELTASDATWEEAYLFADSTFHGLVKTCERQGYEPPEAGFELTDENGAVSMELGLAWSVSRHAVVRHEREAELARAAGWEAQSLEAALIGSQEDG